MSETAEASEVLTIPQPGAEPIELDDQWGHLSRYQEAESRLRGLFKLKDQDKVAPHLLASIARSGGREMPTKDVVEAAKALQAADDLVRLVPSAPIIYHLHCEDAVGVTPEDGTDGFKFVDSNADNDDRSPHWQTVIPTQKLFSLRTGPEDWEHRESFEDDARLEMYSAQSFLVTSNEDAVDRFLHHSAEWMRYPNSRVIVGQQAVDAFLKAKAKEELFDESGESEPSAFKSGWALLASAALKRLGGSSPIGKHGDFVHGAGLEALADVVAVGAGYEGGISHTWRPAYDGNIMRRLAGIDFDPAQDAQVVAQRATERAFSEKGRAGRFDGLLYGERGQVQSHLTEVAGRLIDNFLGAKQPGENPQIYSGYGGEIGI